MIIRSCNITFLPSATEVFNSSDSPADAGIMNSQIISNFPHPIPMLHVGTINYLIVPTFPSPFLSPKYLRPNAGRATYRCALGTSLTSFLFLLFVSIKFTIHLIRKRKFRK